MLLQQARKREAPTILFSDHDICIRDPIQGKNKKIIIFAIFHSDNFLAFHENLRPYLTLFLKTQKFRILLAKYF